MTIYQITFAALPGLALAAGIVLTAPGMARADSHGAMSEHGTMHVTRSPTCGCCGAWVALARAEGFDVTVTNADDVTATKLEIGLPGPLWSCHTALVAGYVIEGHVPFAAVAQLLADRPDVAGIAVPGMPGGAPGMGDDPGARFDVIAFGVDAGAGEVYYQVGL